MHFLIIDGLIRPSGNTERVLQEHIAALGIPPNSPTRFVLRQSNITHCNGCGACKGDKPCIIKDDFSKLLGLAKNADYIMLATPVIFGNTSAYVQNALSRFQSLFNTDYAKLPSLVSSDYEKRPQLGKLKSGIAIITAGGSGGDAKPAETTCRIFLKMLGVIKPEGMYRYNTDKSEI